MLVCGISTALQVTGFRIGPVMFGSGILSVMGVSFASVGIWTNGIKAMIVSNAFLVAVFSTHHHHPQLSCRVCS